MSDKHWKPGQSGNPVGRPTGARTRFTDAFVGDVAAAWEKHGAATLEQMAVTEPAKFAELAAARPPGEILNFVADAIRAHTAKAIQHEHGWRTER
jgi:hypothetical protein